MQQTILHFFIVNYKCCGGVAEQYKNKKAPSPLGAKYTNKFMYYYIFYFCIEATSSAKLSSFFSRPSPRTYKQYS